MFVSNYIKRIKLYSINLIYILFLHFIISCGTRNRDIPNNTKVDLINKKAGITKNKKDNITKLDTKAGAFSLEDLEKMLNDLETKENDLEHKAKNIKDQQMSKETMLEQIKKEKEKLAKEKEDLENQIAEKKKSEKEKEDKEKEEKELEEKELEEKEKKEEQEKKDKELEEENTENENKESETKEDDEDQTESEKNEDGREQFDITLRTVIRKIRDKGGFEKEHKFDYSSLKKFISQFMNLKENFIELRKQAIEQNINSESKKDLKKISFEMTKLLLELQIMIQRSNIANSPFEVAKRSANILKIENKLKESLKGDFKEKALEHLEQHLNIHLDLLRELNKLGISIFYLRGHLSDKILVKKEDLISEFNKKFFINESIDIPEVDSIINQINNEIKEITKKEIPWFSKVSSEYDQIIHQFSKLKFNKTLKDDINNLKKELLSLDYHPLHIVYLSKKLFVNELKELLKIDQNKKDEIKNTKEDKKLFDEIETHLKAHKNLIEALDKLHANYPNMFLTYAHLDPKKDILDPKVTFDKIPDKLGIKITSAVLNDKYLNRIINDTLTKKQKAQIIQQNKEINEHIKNLLLKRKKVQKELDNKEKEKKVKDKEIEKIKDVEEEKKKIIENNIRKKIEDQKAKKDKDNKDKDKRNKEMRRKKEEQLLKEKNEQIERMKQKAKLLEEKEEKIKEESNLNEKIQRLQLEINDLIAKRNAQQQEIEEEQQQIEGEGGEEEQIEGE
ncbi:MAG: hypothetical protein GY830_06240 [Bacteroidetes bacterium]|nr:hypothetical protein [Bacteroidota bacterium]